jgi:hypothetical protein
MPPVARPLFRLEGATITEASGLASNEANDLFYVVQDAGKSAEIFAVDLTGTVRQAFAVPFPNEDWEDLATGVDEQGRRVLYIADTGDAFFVRRDTGRPARTEFAILSVLEPTLPDGRPPSATVPAEEARRFPFVFDDGLNHNAESLLVQPGTGRLFVVDKVEKGRADVPYLWAGPEQAEEGQINTFTKVAQVAVPAASGAAFSPTGDRMVIRNGGSAYLWWVADSDIAAAVEQRPVEVALPPQPQGEGVAFTQDGGALLLNSEGTGSLVWELPLPSEARPQAQSAATEGAEQVSSSSPRRVPLLLAVGAFIGLTGLLTVYRRKNTRRRRQRWMRTGR